MGLTLEGSRAIGDPVPLLPSETNIWLQNVWSLYTIVFYAICFNSTPTPAPESVNNLHSPEKLLISLSR